MKQEKVVSFNNFLTTCCIQITSYVKFHDFLYIDSLLESLHTVIDKCSGTGDVSKFSDNGSKQTETLGE